MAWLEGTLTTGAVSLRFRKMWQVKVDTMAMVDTMGARAEFPLWTYPAFSSNFFSLFLMSAKEKAIRERFYFADQNIASSLFQ